MQINQEQKLILSVIFRQRSHALEAWSRWKQQYDINQVSYATFALLPALFCALRSHGVEDSRLSLLRGIYKQTFCKNAVFLEKLARAISTCSLQGDSLVVSGSAACLLVYHHDWGVRPLQAIELMAPPGRQKAIVSAFKKLDWTEQFESRVQRFYARILERRRFVHRESGEQVIILFPYIYDRFAPGRYQALLAGHELVDLYGTAVTVPGPHHLVDSLLYSCLQARTDQALYLLDLMNLGARLEWRIDWCTNPEAKNHRASDEGRGMVLNWLRQHLNAQIPFLDVGSAIRTNRNCKFQLWPFRKRIYEVMADDC